MKKLILLAALSVASLVSAKNEFKTSDKPEILNSENYDYLKKLNLVEISSTEKNFVEISLKKQENYNAIEISNIYKVNNSENYIVLMKGRVINLKISNTINTTEIIKDISIASSINNDGNGKIKVTDNLSKDYFTATLEKGKLINNNFSTSAGFCQREKNETFQRCFFRESEEFCDDFISTAAYITNQSVQLLIAATCTC